MPAAPTATPRQIKDANTRYHDAAATGYDAKWGIDFGPTGRGQVRAKLAKALGRDPELFGDALEIGAGTGYFSLNLAQLGVIERPTATDISPGMLATLAATAAGLGIEVETVVAEAERLPFEDRSFDLIFGHAVLHHIPNLGRAFSEFARVLRPGGVVAFCGEPSRYGDRIATVPKGLGTFTAPLWRRLVDVPERRSRSEDASDGQELEGDVDVHAFAPSGLAGFARGAGLGEVRVRGEELLASAHGWLMRTLEATAEPDQVPMAWRRFAFRSYLALQRVDGTLLEPHLPPELFYNLVLSARKPA